MKVIIVGGVAGGASCAARLRRLDEKAEIILFEKGEFISFANCGLPYHISGKIKDRDALLLQTPESFNSRFNVDVRVLNEVISIDKEKKTVLIKRVDTNEEYTESYDTLVLSPGSTPLKPPIPGIVNDKILTLWNIPDMDKIIELIKTQKPTSATVVGGGFIGIEMVENLHELGIDVNLIEMQDQVMTNIDFDMAQAVHKELTRNDVNLILSDGVKSFEEIDNKILIKTQKENEILTDLVILAIGVRPNSKLAIDAGLKTNKRGGIVIDKYLKTSDESIYAVGDAVETIDYITKEKTMIPLAGPANKMGRMAADNIAGMKREYKGTLGSSVAKVFDVTVASTGQNQKQLDNAGKKINEDYKVTIMHPGSSAGYYPGSMPLTLKVIFSKSDGKVLGAQSVGYKGVEKRIDVIATSLKFGATVYDLEEIELCYAPPFSSAKDPVNMAGFTGENILSGTIDNITYDEIKKLNENQVILDVRTEQEVLMGEIDGSIEIPVDELRERINELDKSKDYIVSCAVGIRAYIACRILKQNGFNAKNLAGGYTTYSTVSKDYSKIEKKEKVMETPKREIDFTTDVNITVDACGLQCPGPIMKLYEAIKTMEDGEIVNIKSTDPGFFTDCSSWCARTKNTYIKGEKLEDYFSVWIEKGCVGEACNINSVRTDNDKTMVVFSGELDKALASFIIANGAAAMGRNVTMFFTFWGLNVLRKHDKVKVKKSLIEKMFGFMMPRGTQKLKLSSMNMAGMGSKMMKGIMKNKNVATLDELIASAQENGVKMIACTMSMDVMGIKEEELIDGIDLAGVASYLGAAEKADTNLFI